MHYAEYYSSKISSPLLHDDINRTQTYSRIINTLIEHSSNKNFTLMLFIMEHNISIMGSMKSVIGKNYGKIQKAFGKIFECIRLRPTLEAEVRFLLIFEVTGLHNQCHVHNVCAQNGSCQYTFQGNAYKV